jgi:bifunctional non-homologous end joining protein LigD
VARPRLAEYERKRDRRKTPEPFGGKKRGKEPIFVVQRHDARRLHYDFRLEMNGALASWAVPKGIPLEPGQRALAVHVEDHPLEYATFEGEIPKGEYGAGPVEIFDNGTYELLEQKKDGGLTVRLHGKRLEGVWTLVPAKLDGNPKNWLILRKREDGAAPRERRRYRPMLATLADEVPRGGDWLHEVKWDGYRAIAVVRGSEATLTSRNDNDLTGRFESVAREIARAVKTPDCVLDGEVCALDEQGRATFSAMQQGKSGTRYVFVAFDVLEVDGAPVTDLPLTARRERLLKLLDRRNQTVQFSESFDDGDALYRVAQDQGFEGIVSKHRDSKYEPGRRTRSWLKIKTHGRQEFIVAGYTKGQGRRSGRFGSLILGYWQGDELVYAGNVGTGFTDREIDKLLRKLRPLERKATRFREVPKMPKVRKDAMVWVEPKLVAEVEFVEWTHDGRLRAPSYKGLREDKSTEEVRREEPVELETEIRKGKRVLKLSNLDKPFWQDEGRTKGDLLSYYRDVADTVVPHLKDRPFTMKRYPDGAFGKFFFQKDAPTHMPDWIKSVGITVTTRDTPRERRRIRAPLVNDELALLWMVNMGCIDLNTWYSRVDKPDRPDFVLFDLDPSADVGFKETVQVAQLVKQALDTVGLESYPKTSGSDGIHVLVPIARRHSYDETREFAEIIASALARTHYGLVTTEWSRRKRRGVLIDSNQNGEGKTIASVYSVRPKRGAPVSTPLRWDEVNEKLDPGAFTMDVVRERIAAHGDIFEPVLQGRQSLTAALKMVRASRGR